MKGKKLKTTIKTKSMRKDKIACEHYYQIVVCCMYHTYSKVL